MIRLGRRASLLFTLSLLASAATASAECAWVLWVRTQSPNSQPNTMNVVTATATMAECKKAEQEEIARVRASFPSARAAVEGETLHLWREDSMVATMTTLGYYCLPDTVDPRGPKGK